jgi:hypothetical protein
MSITIVNRPSCCSYYNLTVYNTNYTSGGDGAVRLIWPGTTRQFPSSDAAP